MKLKIVLHQYLSFETNLDEDDLEIPAFLRRQKKLMVFKKINECHHKSGKQTFSSSAK